MIFLSTLLLSVLITIALTPVFSTLALRFQLVDIPNERKVHQHPIPRIGGIAMALGAFVPILFWNYEVDFVRAYLIGALVLVVFGLIDDFRELSPRVKFTGQVAAALIAVLYGGVQIRYLGSLLPDGVLLPMWLAVPLTVVAIVGVTNAINLADGLDGLAGGICLLIFAGIGYLAYLGDNAVIGFISLALVGVIYGFLRFNTHPASIFMGDSGSQFLGYSAITLSLALTQQNSVVSPILPLLLLGFPVLDTLTVMCTRIAQGRSPFSADKNHFHHNLLKLGFLHPESVLIIYVFQTVLVIAAVLCRFYSDWFLLAGYLMFCGAVLFGFSRAARTGNSLKRFHFFDVKIAGRLRMLRREGTVIKSSFKIFEFGIPFLLIITCLLATKVPFYVSLAGCGFACLIVLARIFRKEILGGMVRITLYLLIPFAVYLSDTRMLEWQSGELIRLYNATFGIFAVFIIIVSKFSRRKKGFQSTPMDFLIIILAVVVPNLPVAKITEYKVGLMAAKIIMLYFSYEVLMAELRGKYNRLALSTVASLLVLAAR